jgi:Phage terminase large subunit (GpA)
MPERSNGAVSKTVVRASVPWVRIPLPPPVCLFGTFFFCALRRAGSAQNAGLRSHLSEPRGPADWPTLGYRIGIIPKSGLFLTAGVDVQKDRIEVEVVAWGRGKESWSVDCQVIEGDTARAEVWVKLDGVLARDWPHVSGHTLPIRVMCVDAGYATQDVYAWVRRHPQGSWGPAGAVARQPRTAIAVKGRDQDTALLLSVSKADAGGKPRGLRVWSVGTPVAKGELYRWLKLEWPTEEALHAGASYPPGACHFPQYGDESCRATPSRRWTSSSPAGSCCTCSRTRCRSAPGRGC